MSKTKQVCPSQTYPPLSVQYFRKLFLFTQLFQPGHSPFLILYVIQNQGLPNLHLPFLLSCQSDLIITLCYCQILITRLLFRENSLITHGFHGIHGLQGILYLAPVSWPCFCSFFDNSEKIKRQNLRSGKMLDIS